MRAAEPTPTTPNAPPFLTKLYDVLSNPDAAPYIAWCEGGDAFVVLDPGGLATHILPTVWKHNNLRSLIRQVGVRYSILQPPSAEAPPLRLEVERLSVQIPLAAASPSYASCESLWRQLNTYGFQRSVEHVAEGRLEFSREGGARLEPTTHGPALCGACGGSRFHARAAQDSNPRSAASSTPR